MKEKTILIADDRKYPYYFVIENAPTDRKKRNIFMNKARLLAERKIMEDFKEYNYTIEDVREGWNFYFETGYVIEDTPDFGVIREDF